MRRTSGLRFKYSRRAQRLAQQVPQRLERLRNDLHSGHRGHEIRVGHPSRHDVPMQMPRHAGAGHAPQVQAHVEPLGRELAFQEPEKSRHLLVDFKDFLAREIGQAGFVQPGTHEQMSVVIGIAIEHDEALAPLMNNQILAIGRLGGGAAEKTVGIAALGERNRARRGVGRLGLLDVSQAPGRP